jgi:hypothetical protein
MEQVQDVLTKAQGKYIRFAATALLNLDYQIRIGIIAASDQGAPQVRNAMTRKVACLSASWRASVLQYEECWQV